MTDPSFDDLPALFSAVLPHGTVSAVIDQDTGTIASIWTFAMTDPFTYPHKRREKWVAPSLAVARRWCDEALARGQEATVGVMYNANEARYFTEVWITAEQPE